MLDLRELDRRLESVARIERLEKAGLLNVCVIPYFLLQH